MASYNHVTLLGNITRDIELRYLQSGTAVTDIGLAVNEKYKNAAGEMVEDVTFVDCTLWGRTAEVAAEFLGKGNQVLIEGRLKMDSWETADGSKRSKIKLNVDKLVMLGKPNGKNGKPVDPPKSEDGAPAETTSSIPF